MHGSVKEDRSSTGRNFAACGRRVTLPAAARRRKVHSTPFPPGGENCVRSLAPPLPGEPASLGFAGSDEGLGKTPPGTAPEEHRSGAPSRLTPDPVTGVTPWSNHKISGAQNLSECLNPRRATGPWVCEKLGPARFHNCAWVCRTNGTEPFSAVGAALAAARGPVWDRSLPISRNALVLS